MKKILLIIVSIIIVFLLALIFIPRFYLTDSRLFEDLSLSGDGFQIHALVSEGEDPGGKWIILVHGNRGSGQDHPLYKMIRENLSPEYSILAVDLRGFGGSVGEGKNQLPASIDRTEDLMFLSEYLIEKYGIKNDQITLIGHSFGAAQVFKAEQESNFLMVIPIGLGDWDALLASDAGISSYLQKFEANTGIQVSESEMLATAEQFTVSSLFGECPASPVWLVYASQDDAIPRHKEAYESLSEECNGLINWIEVPISDHMYGTETFKLPEPIRGIYSKLSLSLLKYRLDQALRSIE
jgi:alpha/beta superfamily hydrolase